MPLVRRCMAVAALVSNPLSFPHLLTSMWQKSSGRGKLDRSAPCHPHLKKRDKYAAVACFTAASSAPQAKEILFGWVSSNSAHKGRRCHAWEFPFWCPESSTMHEVITCPTCLPDSLPEQPTSVHSCQPKHLTLRLACRHAQRVEHTPHGKSTRASVVSRNTMY